jgi:ECF transporter S component (folate family)
MVVLIVVVIDSLLLCILINLIMQYRMMLKSPGANKAELKQDARKRTEKMSITAMMLAFALALKYFSIELPLMGSNGLRFGFAGIFTAFPAILFGPLYGGITSALTDLLGFFMKPTGDYNFLFTLMGFVGGFLKGLLWLLFKKSGRGLAKAARWIFLGIMCFFLVFGLSVTVSLNRDGITHGIIAHTEDIPEKDNMTTRIEAGEVGAPTKFVGMLTSSKGAKTYQKSFATNANLAGIGIAAVGAAGLIFMGVKTLLRLRAKKKDPEALKKDNDVFIKILFSILISGIVVTTINSKILIELYGIKAPFVVYWLPRLAEEIIVCSLQAYVIAVIYKACEKLFRRKGYID